MARSLTRRPEPLRLRRATAALEALLVGGIGVHLACGFASATRGRRTPIARLVPLTVDVAHDPVPRLRLLPGIGPSRAASIERDRGTNGPVASLDDLDRIPGFGPGIVRNLREAVGVRAVARPDARPGPAAAAPRRPP